MTRRWEAVEGCPTSAMTPHIHACAVAERGNGLEGLMIGTREAEFVSAKSWRPTHETGAEGKPHFIQYSNHFSLYRHLQIRFCMRTQSESNIDEIKGNYRVSKPDC